MKWETVKEKVGKGVYTQIIQCRSWETMATILVDSAISGIPVNHEELQRYANKAYEIIQKWDVRCVGKLRELFPQHFPPSLKGPLHVEMADNENGDWIVYSIR